MAESLCPERASGRRGSWPNHGADLDAEQGQRELFQLKNPSAPPLINHSTVHHVRGGTAGGPSRMHSISPPGRVFVAAAVLRFNGKTTVRAECACARQVSLGKHTAQPVHRGLYSGKREIYEPINYREATLVGASLTPAPRRHSTLAYLYPSDSDITAIASFPARGNR